MASFVSSTGCAGHYGTRNRCQMGQPSFIGREQKVVTIVKLKFFFLTASKRIKSPETSEYEDWLVPLCISAQG